MTSRISRALKARSWPILRAALAKGGVDAFVHRPDYHYVPDYYGRSAHKHYDIREEPIFGELASQVISDGRTLLYYDRLYTIYQAVRYVVRRYASTDVEMLNLAEVGVYKGGTSYFISSLLARLKCSRAALHGFDTFEGHAAIDIATENFREPFHKAGMFSETAFDSVRAYLEQFPYARLYQGRFQETCDQVRGRPFHFVHLDVDLYEVTRAGLEFFDEHLVTGGIIVVDDYGFYTCPGVKRAVDEFIEPRPHYLPLHLLTGQCVLTKA